MALLRSIAILILIVAVMPWGAYAGALAARSPVLVHAVPAVTDADVSQSVVSKDGQDSPGLIMPKPKRCRTAVLIGSACGPDVAIPGSAIPVDLSAACRAVPTADAMQLVGLTPPGSLDPPRFC